MSSRRTSVVVTGMGVGAAGAHNPDDLFAVALGGRSPAMWITLPGVEQPLAASVAPEPELGGQHLRYARRLDRSAQLGLAAAREAIAEAGLARNVDLARVGAIVGTSRGTIARTLATADDLAAGSTSPTASADSTPTSMCGVIAQSFGFGGPSVTVMATCASGASAIGLGALHLVAGDADAMVVGGAEAPIVPLLAAQLSAAGVTGWHDQPARTCRPFDEQRNGLMVGEGAAFLVLEREDDAYRRGAPVLARLSGWAAGIDGGGRTGVTADGDGLVRVVSRALAVAGLQPSDIDYVNAHGTGTRLNDAVEARALMRMFGRDDVPPTSSTKPITGHCLGATPAIEAVIAIKTLLTGFVPPTANLEQLDPECPIDVIAGEARQVSTRAVLSTSLGFWGTQGALIFETA